MIGALRGRLPKGGCGKLAPVGVGLLGNELSNQNLMQQLFDSTISYFFELPFLYNTIIT